MHKDTTIPFTNPAFRDELSELVREGAQKIIRQAVEVELGAFLEEHATERDRRREVRRWSERQRNGQEGRWIQDGHTPDLTVTRWKTGRLLINCVFLVFFYFRFS